MNRTRRRKLARRAARKARRGTLKAWRASTAAFFDEQAANAERAGNGWSGSVHGACPVQGTGLVDGWSWYFRARGEEWSFEVWPPGMFTGGDLPGEHAFFWAAGEALGADFFAGSWMPAAEAWQHIEASIAAFRARRAELGAS